MKITEGNIYLLNELSQLTLFILFWFRYPVFFLNYKCNENTGIGTRYRQVLNNKSIGIGLVLKKAVSMHP